MLRCAVCKEMNAWCKMQGLFLKKEFPYECGKSRSECKSVHDLL